MTVVLGGSLLVSTGGSRRKRLGSSLAPVVVEAFLTSCLGGGVVDLLGGGVAVRVGRVFTPTDLFARGASGPGSRGVAMVAEDGVSVRPGCHAIDLVSATLLSAYAITPAASHPRGV